MKLDLIPTEIIPKKRHIVGNLEWAILIKESKLTTASWSSCQPYHHWIALAAPRFKEKVEHPAKFSCVKNNNNAKVLISKNSGQLHESIDQFHYSSGHT